MNENIDVDLEALLKGTEELNSEDNTNGASAVPNETANDSTVALKQEEDKANAEASIRAQDRIRELVEENARLKEAGIPKDEFSDVETFINAIEDEPSRKLLQQYSVLLEKKLSSQFSPVLSEYHQSKFDKEFDTFALKAPSLNAYKEELKKSFNRNPNQSLKALIGEVVVENLLTRVKPIEKQASVANRNAPDLSLVDKKEDLYAILESMKGQPIN